MHKFATKTIIPIAEKRLEREFVTFAGVIRKKPCQKTSPHPGPKGTTKDGKTELREVDHSGHNHILLGDLDSIKEQGKMEIHGIFTTSESPYKGVKPTKVSETTLNNQNKPQYMHEKNNTVIAANDVEIDHTSTQAIRNDPDIVKHCNRITTEKNLD